MSASVSSWRVPAIGLVVAVVGLGLAAPGHAASPIPDGEWLGAVEVRHEGGKRDVRTTLELSGGGGSGQVGELRFSSPFDCDIDVEFVSGDDGSALYNVTTTTATGFCRRYDSGSLQLGLADEGGVETVQLQLDTAAKDPDWRQTGTLGQDVDN